MFKMFIFFTLVVIIHTPQMAFSLSDQSLRDYFDSLNGRVSAEEAKAIEEEMQLREMRGAEEETRLKEEELANRSGSGFHGENINQVKGVMITFVTYPLAETQKTSLVEKLEKEGLKKDAEIKRFKMWIYNWENAQEGGKAEVLCKELLAFSFVEDCSSNAYTHPEYSVDIVKKAKQMVQSAEQKLKKTKQRVKRAEKLLKQYQEKLAVRQKMVKEAEQWVKAAEQRLQAARRGGVPSTIKSAEKRLIFYKKWLESRVKWLENTEKWVDGRKKWLEKTNEWLERDKKWLESRKQWLDKMRNALAKKPIQTPPQAPSQTPSQPPQTPPSKSPSESNLKTCNIVPHNLNRYHVFSYKQKKDSPLSDYWAQEMIGADLLKKEMQDLPPIKKHFIQLFDVNIPKGPSGHDHIVQNLISDGGKHSVLPRLGQNSIGINQTPTTGDMVKYSDEMLTKAEGKCAHLKSEPSSEGFINQGGSLQ